MRIKLIFILVILMFGFSFSFNFGNQRDDDYGKLVGWIVDPVTEKPVNEIFNVELFRCNINKSERYLKSWRTDKRGYFSLEVKPGQYCLHISPQSMGSKYCVEPYHFYDKRFSFPVMIEKGKITEFRKKATYGGSLEITLQDTSGRQINPTTELPEGARISISIDSSFYLIGQFSQYHFYDDISDGKMIVHTMFPGKYNVEVTFYGTGYETLSFDDIQVKAKEVKKIKCVIDLNDTTGIEGRVIDANGNPIKDLKVFMSPKFSVEGSFSDITDQNGYYRIIGLPEGPYHIGISSLTKGVRIFPEIIEIKKNVVLNKDVIVD